MSNDYLHNTDCAPTKELHVFRQSLRFPVMYLSDAGPSHSYGFFFVRWETSWVEQAGRTNKYYSNPTTIFYPIRNSEILLRSRHLG